MTFEANESIFHLQIENNITWFKMSIVLKGRCLNQNLEYISVFMCSEINVIVSIYFRLDIGNIIREDCFQMLDTCMFLHIAYLFPCRKIVFRKRCIIWLLYQWIYKVPKYMLDTINIFIIHHYTYNNHYTLLQMI